VDGNELVFCTALYFDEDDVIRSYRHRHPARGEERCPPVEEQSARVSIGYIYLSIHKDLARLNSPHELERYCLFEFGTPGTTMSILFDYSPSIRKTFVDLLESVPGVRGIFDREKDGCELFWLRGQFLGGTSVFSDGLQSYHDTDSNYSSDYVFRSFSVIN
jgi:hypothetical protein